MAKRPRHASKSDRLARETSRGVRKPAKERKPQPASSAPRAGGARWEIPSRGLSLPAAGVVILLAALLSRYLYSADFGLYEDDYPRVIGGMEVSLTRVLHQMWEFLSGFQGQGRPLHPGFIRLFSHLGSLIGSGLHGVYLLAFLIFALNGFLLYLLLRRVTGMPMLALVSALAFCLYPADTTQAYLTMAFGGQTSITLLLAAAHCYYSRWRPYSYLIAFASLICYETVFPLFLAVPLLEGKWDARLLRRLAVHVLIIGGMMGFIAFLREIVGESRVVRLGPQKLITTIFEHMYTGPLTSLRMFFQRPWEFLRHGLAVDRMLLAPAFLGLLAVLLIERVPELRATALRRLGRIAAAGFALLIIAYPLTFTIQPWVTNGRGTRVHMAAAIGAALLWGCLWTLLFGLGRRWWVRVPAAVICAIFFTGMLAFGLDVQRDYRSAWALQRSFWSDAVRVCPDLDRGTVILLSKKGFKRVKQIDPWGWFTPYILRTMYAFPGNWGTTPTLYGLRSNWRRKTAMMGDVMAGRDLRGYHDEKFDHPKFIYLEQRDGRLYRPPGPLKVGEYEFELKPVVPEGKPKARMKLLGHLLLDGTGNRMPYVNYHRMRKSRKPRIRTLPAR